MGNIWWGQTKGHGAYTLTTAATNKTVENGSHSKRFWMKHMEEERLFWLASIFWVSWRYTKLLTKVAMIVNLEVKNWEQQLWRGMEGTCVSVNWKWKAKVFMPRFWRRPRADLTDRGNNWWLITQVVLEVKNPSACQCRRLKRCGFSSSVGISFGEENGTPLQFSCLRNPMDRGAWRATVHGVTKSQTQLNIWACLGN